MRGSRTSAVAILAGAQWILRVTRASAKTDLILWDGSRFSSASVRLDGADYVLTLADGALTFPWLLVWQIRITGEPKEPPTGLVVAEPKVLAGPARAIEPPTTEEPLRVLGKPAHFKPDVVQSSLPVALWTPGKPGNDSAPSRWARSPIPFEWTAQSAFDGKIDVLAPGHSRVSWSLVDPTWVPVDGYGRESEER